MRYYLQWEPHDEHRNPDVYMSLYLGQVPSAYVLRKTLEAWENARAYSVNQDVYTEEAPGNPEHNYTVSGHPQNAEDFVGQVYEYLKWRFDCGTMDSRSSCPMFYLNTQTTN